MWQQIKNFYHLLIAHFARFYFRKPDLKLRLIGVTGTDGKTTTVSLIHHLLNTAGKKTALISSVGAKIGTKSMDIGFHVTTPNTFDLMRYFQMALYEKCEFLVLEITSHALDQNRVAGLKFEVGVITNITHEHLDYHGDMDSYATTKMKLLEQSKIGVINSSSKFKNSIQNSKIITFGMNADADINSRTFPFKTDLPGEFNRYNCLGAIAVGKVLGVSDKTIREGVKSFRGVLGRMDKVYDHDFKVIIDFAHTPNALAQVLPIVKKMAQKRLIHVFGSAGLRDKTKRPLMGNISSRYADVIILTAEDPRTENVDEIITQIESGARDQRPETKDQILKIPDRQQAINKALMIAQKGDVIIITGKGHEKSMCFGKKEYPWDEYEAVRKGLKAKFSVNVFGS